MTTRLGRPKSGWSAAGGSDSKTSRAAPAIRPDSKRLSECWFVDQSSARAIDDPHGRLHQGDALGVDHPFGLLGQRHVERDEIRLADRLFDRFLQFDAQRLRPLGTEIWIIGEDAHAECQRPLREFTADSAHPEDGERFAVEFDPLELLALPLSGDHAGVRLRDVAGERNHEGERMLGGGDGVAAWRVHDDHAVGRGRGDIDIVDADACAADCLQVGCSGQRLER